MTQQEYQQKKRECWEEFCESDKPYDVEPAFAFAFDRAYELGKQFGNSEQVDVEKAAKRFADEIRIPASIPGVMAPFINGLAHDAYLQGAQDSLGKQETKQESKQETVIQGWVAVDDDGDLFLYRTKPARDEVSGMWLSHECPLDVGINLFPDLSWDDDPQEVEIVIKRKKNG